jgi:hypothetical protein
MPSKEIHSIVEGCMPDTPMQLMYAGIEFQIPKNANVLFWSHDIHPKKYLLYGKAKNFTDFEIINNPYFQFEKGLDVNNLIKGGVPIRYYEPNFNWIFDAQRSLTTKDGRIYIQGLYFESRWRWYLERVPKILRESEEIFKKNKLERKFSDNPLG